MLYSFLTKMFHFIYNCAREPVEEERISIDDAIRIIQEKGANNQVLTLQGRLQRQPFIDNKVNPTNLMEKIQGFFGTNPTDITITSQFYEGRNGEGREHYLHMKRDGKELVIKYLNYTR